MRTRVVMYQQRSAAMIAGYIIVQWRPPASQIIPLQEPTGSQNISYMSSTRREKGCLVLISNIQFVLTTPQWYRRARIRKLVTYWPCTEEPVRHIASNSPDQRPRRVSSLRARPQKNEWYRSLVMGARAKNGKTLELATNCPGRAVSMPFRSRLRKRIFIPPELQFRAFHPVPEPGYTSISVWFQLVDERWWNVSAHLWGTIGFGPWLWLSMNLTAPENGSNAVRHVRRYASIPDALLKFL